MSKKQDILSIKSSILKEKKQKSCGFYNTINHTANKYPTNIGQIIDDDLLAEFLQETCPFKVLETYLCANVFCE